MKRPYETDTLSTIKEFAPTIIKIAIIPLLIIIGLIAWNIFGANTAYAYVRDYNYVTGSRDSKVKVLYYQDFQCSACRSNHTNVQGFEAQIPENVALVQRHLPLQSLHPLAPSAARAAQAASYQGKFSEMADKIFANQDSLSGDNLKRWAGEIDMDYAQWEQDWNGNKVREEVEQDMADLKNMELPANDQGVVKKRGDSGSGTPFTIIVVDDKAVWWSIGGWASPGMIFERIAQFSDIANPTVSTDAGTTINADELTIDNPMNSDPEVITDPNELVEAQING